MDVCGPLEENSRGGPRYLAAVLDKFSRLSTVVPITYRSEVASVGKEGLSIDKGVKHETAVPYTPEQNGAAERFNRTLMERVSAMLIDAQLVLCRESSTDHTRHRHSGPL